MKSPNLLFGSASEGEAATLEDLGVELLQGYLFAKPGFQSLPAPVWPVTATRAAA